MRVARIRGVDIKLHFSLLFILFYVVLVASARFPLVVDEAGVDQAALLGGPFAWGVVFAVALFVSVLLHELAHVFVAQSMGVKVRGITLMMLGGISEMEQMPDKRFQEFKVAIVGPITSLAIAAALLSIERFATGSNIVLFSHWLGRVNLVLAIFNLLPAFPLDGGRVLRSLIAARQGNLRATQSAVKIGKVFAWFFGIVGFLQFNILLMLIALFLYMAASSELVLVTGKNILKGLKVRDVTRRITPINDNAAIAQAAREMLQSKNLVLPVQSFSGQAALVNLGAIRKVPGRLRAQMRVRDIMEPTSKALFIDDDIDKSLTDIAMTPSRALPVLDGSQVVGLVLYSDIAEILQLKALADESSSDIRPAA